MSEKLKVIKLTIDYYVNLIKQNIFFKILKENIWKDDDGWFWGKLFSSYAFPFFLNF